MRRRGREDGKRTLSTKSVSSEEVRDETSRGDEGREGGERTSIVSEVIQFGSRRGRRNLKGRI